MPNNAEADKARPLVCVVISFMPTHHWLGGPALVEDELSFLTQGANEAMLKKEVKRTEARAELQYRHAKSKPIA